MWLTCCRTNFMFVFPQWPWTLYTPSGVCRRCCCCCSERKCRWWSEVSQELPRSRLARSSVTRNFHAPLPFVLDVRSVRANVTKKNKQKKNDLRRQRRQSLFPFIFFPASVTHWWDYTTAMHFFYFFCFIWFYFFTWQQRKRNKTISKLTSIHCMYT